MKGKIKDLYPSVMKFSVISQFALNPSALKLPWIPQLIAYRTVADNDSGRALVEQLHYIYDCLWVIGSLY